MFLLYQKKHKAFQKTVQIGGKLYDINADFRNILRIFAMLGDENIPGERKQVRLREWLFEDDVSEIVSVGESINIFSRFIGMNSQVELYDKLIDTDSEPQFCYDFDAKEIYAGFLSEYGIDLFDVDFLHWYKFKLLLENLPPESAFKRKIELRFMDVENMSALGGKKFGELLAAKEAVQLPGKYESDESEESQDIKEFNETWGKAGNN